jgi:hypothetical protein
VPLSSGAARLDSGPLSSPEKTPAARSAPARVDRPFRGIALIITSTFAALGRIFRGLQIVFRRLCLESGQAPWQWLTHVSDAPSRS